MINNAFFPNKNRHSTKKVRERKEEENTQFIKKQNEI